MRKGKRSKPSVQAWLFALAMPAVALFMLFSLLPYDRMVAPWPLGIAQREVMAFQQLFDRRPGQHVEGQAERFTLAGTDGALMLIAEDGDEAPATRVPLPAGANAAVLNLDFAADRPFRGATALALAPAGLGELSVLYAQAVADSLDLLAPPVNLVLFAQGEGKATPHLVQERITPEHLLKHAPVAMALFAPDGTVPGDERGNRAFGDTIGDAAQSFGLRPDRFDTAATAALGLLACAEQRPALLDGLAGTLHDRVTGAVRPLYRMASGAFPQREEAVATAFRTALADAANQQRIARLAARMQADSAAWAARFLAIDSMAVPVLAHGRNLGLAQAEVDRAREAFMQRLFHPHAAACIGAPVSSPAPEPLPLDPWLEQFRTEPDTLRFVRGKYSIDHDLVLPHGMAVVLERGARWFMAPGVSVVVHGELHMRGTDLNPVFIRPLADDQPWGAIAVNGNGDTRVRIRGLRISGGSDLLWEGVQHGGMLSFIGVDARIDHCRIGGNQGEAAISLRRGRIAMADCQLFGAAQGFITLAEMRGAIERTAFVQPAGGRDATGRNGLLMRASHVLVRGCTFADLPFAALRMARGSEALVMRSSFSGNSTAIAAVDGSLVHVDGCDFTGNGKVFVLRRERPVLGGAQLRLNASNFSGNGAEHEVDAASTLDTGIPLDPQVLSAFTTGTSE